MHSYKGKKKKVIKLSPSQVRKAIRRWVFHSLAPPRIFTPPPSPTPSPLSPKCVSSEELEMVNQDNKNIFEYATPMLKGLLPTISRPVVQANNFEIKTATIHLLHIIGLFGGSTVESLNNHILSFLEI
ncbi:uncharacterized protein G2W53_016446 [Senna tora]|uniref:Uncharacterized protein n=1 Tax=Senna tora TaxID=362788 RepID=A0A834TPY4_9FABA|nr:uncharacterized protein G2W53_016446 [Senna tora]